MKLIDKLIKELCPEGLNYVPIGSVVNYIQPTKYIVKNTDYDNSYKTPVLTAGQTFILGFTNETNNIYGADKENPVIIFDDFTGAYQWVDFNFKVKSSAMKILKVDDQFALRRYIYHMMGKIGLRSDEHKRLWISNYALIEIPLPPLEIQQEIVRILDTMTNLTAELTAELTARKKQYEYYRDMLLNFEGNNPLGELLQEHCPSGVERMKIKDYFKRIKGTPITAGKMKEIANEFGEIKVFAGGKTLISANESDIPNANITRVPAVLVQSRGVIDVLYIEEPFTFKNEMWAYTHAEQVTIKFLFYTLKKNVKHLRDAGSGMGSLPQISLTVTEDLYIPIPPLVVQQKIVDILDRFDVYCNDITKGLPAEIEARQKQYEYYRNKLLTFKEL